MAVMSLVNRSQLEGTKRLDAEYYQPAYLNLEHGILRAGSYTVWNQIDGQFVTRPFGSEFTVDNYVASSPYRYVRGQDVKEFFLRGTDNVYIPQKDFERLSKYALTEGDILVSVVGTLGNTAVVDKGVLPAIFSCKSTLFRSKAVNPFYFIAYLNCRAARTLLQRKVRGAVQTGLNIDDLRSLPIFLPKRHLQDKIAQIVLDAKGNYDVSNSLCSQAETLLLEELRLKNFKPKYELSYTANLSIAFSAHRADAEYFQPCYENLVVQLTEAIEMKPLRHFLLDIKKGTEIGGEQYQEEGKPFIRVSNISVSGLIERDQKYLDEELYEELAGQYKPKVGELLLTKDATPGIAYVVKESIKGIISSGILRLAIDETKIDKEYLALCINSLIGKLQIERDGGGSVIRHWRPGQIKRLLVPVLPHGTQQKIASLVQQSHEARKKAKELIEKSKRAVEIAVDEGEAQATAFLSA
jgi:restriction endonuclease S subunit